MRMRKQGAVLKTASIALAVIAGLGVIGWLLAARLANSAEVESRLDRLGQDIGVFRQESATLEPQIAVDRWFALFDRASKLGFDARSYDVISLAPDGVDPAELFSTLPPPPAWQAFREEAKRRVAANVSDREALTLRFLGEVLTRDRAEANATLELLEKSGAPRGEILGTRALLTRIYGSADEQLAAVEEEIRGVAELPVVSIPDLVAIAGEDRARPLLRSAVTSTAAIQIEGGAPTRMLARRIALDDIDKLARPQWNLAADLDGAELYEALAGRFGSQPSDHQWREATTYYFLQMVKDGRQAEAEAALQGLAGADSIRIPHDAVTALQRARLNEPLFRFLDGHLARHPDSAAWDLYLEQAAYTGHSRAAIKRIETLLAAPGAAAATKSALRIRHADALAAVDDIEGAAREYFALLAASPGGQSPLIDREFAVRVFRFGRLTDRAPLLAAAEAFLKPGVAANSAPADRYSFEQSRRSYWKELRLLGREEELRASLDNRLEELKSAATEVDSPDEYYLMSEGKSILIELVSIHSKAGRHAAVADLLDNVTLWNARDLSEVLGETDSLGLPLGASVARAFGAAGGEQAALRVARATVAALPGNDAAYEIVAARDPQAILFFEERFALDEFEERPLIWKASRQLAEGAIDAAEATVRQAIAIDPSDGEEGPNDRMRAYAVLSEILRRKGATADAALYARAVEAIRISEHADQLYAAGLYRRAFADYRAALEKFSDAYCIQSRLAVQLNKQGYRAEALEHYRRAYELMPSSFGRVESHCFGCESVFQDDESQSIAEGVFADIIRKSPGRAQAHYLLAYLREQQGRYEDAVRPLRAAVSIDDRYLNAWKRLQDLGEKTYIDAGERDIARLKLLQLDPLQRHGYYSLDHVGQLTELWNGADRARDIASKSARPAKVHPLRASAAHQAKMYGEPSEELAALLRGDYSLSQGAAQGGAKVLGDHALVLKVKALLVAEGVEGADD
jgi:tetratricopeptide (TPR) repeat protein